MNDETNIRVVPSNLKTIIMSNVKEVYESDVKKTFLQDKLNSLQSQFNILDAKLNQYIKGVI